MHALEIFMDALVLISVFLAPLLMYTSDLTYKHFNHAMVT